MVFQCLKNSLFNLIPKNSISGLGPLFEFEEGSVQGLGKMNEYPIPWVVFYPADSVIESATKQGLGGD